MKLSRRGEEIESGDQTTVVTRLLDALNAHDIEDAAALFAEDYRSEQPAHPGRTFVGRAQMYANWEAMFLGIPDFHAQLPRLTQDGDTVWSEWVWLGTLADGAPFEARGVIVFQLRGDLIAEASLYMEDVGSEQADIQTAVEDLSGQRPFTRSGGSRSTAES